jgi:hypothetical protein
MVDRSDPIAASAYSRSSSRDCCSGSSSRTKRSFEEPRVQNRSTCPHRSLGSRRTGMRSSLPKTSHGSAPPSSKASGTPSAKEAGFQSPTSSSGGWLHGQNDNSLDRSWCRRRQHVRWAQGRSRASSLPRHDGRLDGGVSLGSSPHGNSRRLGPPLGASCAEASQLAWRGAALAAEAGTVLRAFLGAGSAEPCLRFARRKR